MSGLGGKYQLGERIGGGGMADVFRATTRGAEGFARPVAIKRIKRSISTNKGFAKLFVKEARLAAKLSHPNVVQTLDFDRDEKGCFYIVMELIDGIDLRTLTKSGRVPVTACCFIISEILRALDYAHELVADGRPITIVHRDISPHNIMLGWQGAVKVVDFGIAKAIEGSLISRSGSLKGKVAYMSPEQVHGQALDGRSDLFAVGVIFHELLTGQRLFVGKSEAETLSKLLTQPIPSPRSLNDQVPQDLDTIVMRLLSRDRDDRYRRARDAMDTLLEASISTIRGRQDLETVLQERFPDRAPQRTARISHTPSLASSSSFETIPSQPESVLRDTVANKAQSSTSNLSNPATKPLPRRTFTARDAQRPKQELPVFGKNEAPLGRENLPPPAPATRSRLPILMAVALLAVAAVVTFFALRGGEGEREENIGIELVEVKGSDSGPLSIMDAAPEISDSAALETSDAPAKTTQKHDRKKQEEQEQEQEQEEAVLTFRIKPWANIEIDGKDYGQTPRTIKLPHGKHKIILTNPGLERSESFSLTLEPGQEKTIKRTWP